MKDERGRLIPSELDAMQEGETAVYNAVFQLLDADDNITTDDAATIATIAGKAYTAVFRARNEV